jgi:hypothetical protein
MTADRTEGTSAFLVGDHVRIVSNGLEGHVGGYVRVDSFRYGRRHLVVVNLPDGRRYEQPATDLELVEGAR